MRTRQAVSQAWKMNQSATIQSAIQEKSRLTKVPGLIAGRAGGGRLGGIGSADGAGGCRTVEGHAGERMCRRRAFVEGRGAEVETSAKGPRHGWSEGTKEISRWLTPPARAFSFIVHSVGVVRAIYCPDARSAQEARQPRTAFASCSSRRAGTNPGNTDTSVVARATKRCARYFICSNIQRLSGP